MKIDGTHAQLESILTSEAHHSAVLADGQPAGSELSAPDKEYYERIINTYRNAVREVNDLFEENIAFLSGFSQLFDNVRDTNDFGVICSYVLDCVLQDFGAEYSSLVFFDPTDSPSLEGMREECRFLRIHSRPEILGSERVQQILVELARREQGSFTIDDVYREPDFARIDFPGVVRSIACSPLVANGEATGLLIAGHSRPKYFTDNHIRVLRILAGFASHLHFLIRESRPSATKSKFGKPKTEDVLSVALLELRVHDSLDRWIAAGSSLLSSLRTRFYRAVAGKGSAVFRGDRELVILLPGLAKNEMHEMAARLKLEYQQWQSDQNGILPEIRMNLGYITCEGDVDLERMLEMLDFKTNPDAPEEEAAGVL